MIQEDPLKNPTPNNEASYIERITSDYGSEVAQEFVNLKNNPDNHDATDLYLLDQAIMKVHLPALQAEADSPQYFNSPSGDLDISFDSLDGSDNRPK